MKVIVGGAYQGKLNLVLEQYEMTREQVLDGQEMSLWQSDFTKCRVLNHTNLVVKRLLEEKQEIWPYFQKILDVNSDMIFIADEVGCGVVPMEHTDREYREHVGRLLCELVKRADSLERVICGISMKLK